MEQIENNRKKIEQYASELMLLARDTITVRFRFFDAALTRLTPVSRAGIFGFGTDGSHLYYDPVFLLQNYMEEPNIAVRAYLHILLHCIFFHLFQYDKLNKACWNLAVDIAVENIILEMEFPSAGLSRDEEAKEVLERLKKRLKKLTAEKLYQEFMQSPLSDEDEQKYRNLFSLDSHDGWQVKVEKETKIRKEDWKKISDRMKTDLKTFSKNKSNSESLSANLNEAVRERYDYREILEQFMVMGEEMKLDDEEFDYVYYTYGLSLYGNVPLVEPMEYKEVHKIKEFVIAIDTSASCKGEMVQAFLRKTYDIMKGTENFFQKINLHIIQCDAEVRSDTKIETDTDFDEFISNGKLTGFGSTDFRPVFSYVEQLKSKGEFENLKGLIYFTDGYGIYPESMPDYQVIFAFLNDDETRPDVPGWAIKLVMEDELREY